MCHIEEVHKGKAMRVCHAAQYIIHNIISMAYKSKSRSQTSPTENNPGVKLDSRSLKVLNSSLSSECWSPCQSLVMGNSMTTEEKHFGLLPWEVYAEMLLTFIFQLTRWSFRPNNLIPQSYLMSLEITDW